MKIPYTWYRRRHETHYYYGRLVISRLIVWAWIVAICVCICAGLIAFSNADAAFDARQHATDATWLAVISLVVAGANHLLLSVIGAWFDHADRTRWSGHLRAGSPPAAASAQPADPAYDTETAVQGIPDLLRRCAWAGIDPDAYRIFAPHLPFFHAGGGGGGGGGDRDATHDLEWSQGRWRVARVAHGAAGDEAFYADEADACREFLRRLLDDPDARLIAT